MDEVGKGSDSNEEVATSMDLANSSVEEIDCRPRKKGSEDDMSFSIVLALPHRRSDPLL